MKAVVVRAFGGPEVLALEDLPDPRPGPGQVLVSVRAVGVNPVETYVRAGAYGRLPPLPYTPGTDAAGVVEAVGAGAPYAAGDRVYLYGAVGGTYAQKAVAESTRVFPLPPALSFEQGAAIGVPYGTAHRALFHHGGARPGETVLVHGASGGVGVAAVQLAAAAGLTVIGTAGGPDGVAFVKGLGAALALDHRVAGYLDEAVRATGGRGPDLIVEMLANANLPEDLRVAAARGRVVIVGSRGKVEIDPRLTMSKDLAVRGMSLWNMGDDERVALHAALAPALASGALRPVVGRAFPLADAAKAHEAILAPGARGKIVLVP
ncbi:MAG: NADPH:quinone reductase [Elusimicrobiota bacterium]|nr:NADPH:quinone reductase [Elusimicrobiota bacterium]